MGFGLVEIQALKNFRWRKNNFYQQGVRYNVTSDVAKEMLEYGYAKLIERDTPKKAKKIEENIDDQG